MRLYLYILSMLALLLLTNWPASLLQLDSNIANATTSPRPLGGEHRIKIINYMPNTVFKYTGHYFYQSIIEFDINEQIQTISMGTPTPWQLIPAGNRIFLKPIAEDAETNMTVVTDKRMYFFEMHAKNARDVSDNDLSFIVKFVYPENQNNIQFVSNVGNSSAPDLANPELYNLNYTISGDAPEIEPVQVFDDERFTFFRFTGRSEIPAIFSVSSDGQESLVNHRVEGEYIVVERVGSAFTLRSGGRVICVFNDAHADYLSSSR